VGIFERFSESVRMCLRLLGVACEDAPFLNTAPRDTAIDEKTYAVIRERHYFDYELYSYALARFRRQEAV